MTPEERNTYMSLIQSETSRLMRETGQNQAMVYSQAVANVHAAADRSDTVNEFYNELMNGQAAAARAAKRNGNGARKVASQPVETSGVTASMAELKSLQDKVDQGAASNSNGHAQAVRAEPEYQHVTIRHRSDRGFGVALRYGLLGRDMHVMYLDESKARRLALKLDEIISALMQRYGGQS